MEIDLHNLPKRGFEDFHDQPGTGRRAPSGKLHQWSISPYHTTKIIHRNMTERDLLSPANLKFSTRRPNAIVQEKKVVAFQNRNGR